MQINRREVCLDLRTGTKRVPATEAHLEPDKHLRWRFLLNVVNYFCKKLHLTSVFEFFNGTFVGYQFFKTQSWARIPGSTMIHCQPIVTFKSTVLQTRIYKPVKHLRWGFWLIVVNFFVKSSLLDVWLTLSAFSWCFFGKNGFRSQSFSTTENKVIPHYMVNTLV